MSVLVAVLAKVLAAHQDSHVSLEEDCMPGYLVRCQGDGEVDGCSWEKFAYTYDAAVDEWRSHVASELVEQINGPSNAVGIAGQRVETREQLDALDDLTVVIDQYAIVYQRVKSDGAWWQMGVSNMSGKRSHEITLPVLAIWSAVDEHL